jgi:hypothetical protein
MPSPMAASRHISVQEETHQVLQLTHNFICIDVPAWYMNPDFKIILKEQDDFNSMAARCPLTLALQVHNVMNSKEPWLQHKYDCRCYRKTAELQARWPKSPAVHQAELHSRLSCLSLRHALLVTSPSAGLIPRARGYFIALEVVFTLIFHACTPTITDMFVHELLLCPRTAVEWDPVCSHLPLIGAICGGLSMSATELERQSAIRTARAKETNNIQSQRFRAK